MLNTVDDIFEAAESLDRHSQFELAEMLVRKLGASAEHQELWAKEAERRSKAFESGELGASDASEVIARIRRSIKR